MPVTSAEIAENIDLDESHVVAGNIQSGIYYFTKLFQLFPNTNPIDHLCLTLAAYNAGPSRIYDAQELAAYMGENPNSWSTIQKILPLLSKRYYSLHQAVWSDGRPRSGYFGSSHQTISYVENTMKIYQDIL
jgi:membrane-bound lytic murein transglycosylase MltF